MGWLRRSITGKMLLLTMVLSTSLWLVMEWLQGRELRAAFFQKMTDELISSASDDRRLFDLKLRETSSSVRLIATQKRFIDYVSRLTPETGGAVRHYSASQPPAWLPNPSVMRVFFSARYALLLDRGDVVREVYHNVGGDSDATAIPALLLQPSLLLRKLSHNQFYLTTLDNFPYVIASKEVAEEGQLIGRLLLASPLDDRYLNDAVSMQAHNTIIALVDATNDTVIASSRAQAIARGTKLKEMAGYLQTGKSFFDYGASDLTVQFVSLIATGEVEQRINTIMQMNSRQRTILVSVLFVAFIVLTLWLAMRIRRLSARVNRRSQRVLGLSLEEIGDGDELDCLQQQFERFSSEVERVRGELQQELDKKSVLSDSLQQNNRSLEALNAQLQRAKEEADLANRAKSEFLSSMSHELRTPLNAILGFTQLLEGDANLCAEQRESLHDIANAGNHLLELINDVLDLAKIESGKVELVITDVALREVIAAAKNLIMPMAEKHGIALEFAESCVSECAVHADFTRTKQVLLNLLTNAIKYNRPQGTVRVACQQTASRRLHISVSDTGRGISEAQLGGLFESFNRLDAEGSNIEGTGIGLVITRQLVGLMGGEMGVESRLGEGSTFWFELPCAEAPASAQRGTAVAVSQGATTVGAGRTVLYIEDNPVNLKLVQKLIEKRTAITLLSAEEPLAGIKLAVAQRPDLILLDINLPQMSGFEVLQRLREMAPTRDIPVVALSANAMAADLQKGEAAGFNGYLTKPLNVKAFLATLQRMLG